MAFKAVESLEKIDVILGRNLVKVSFIKSTLSISQRPKYKQEPNSNV